MMKKDLTDNVGLGQLIVGSNWKTADDRNLGGLERRAYSVTDVVCRNAYFAVDYPKGDINFPKGNPEEKLA